MRKFWKLGVPAAMFVVAASVGAMGTNRAYAGDYCRTDITAHMTSCPYDTMEQCQMTRQGNGGDCFRDPNLPANTASNAKGATRNGNAFAYAPRGARADAHRGRYGQAASPD